MRNSKHSGWGLLIAVLIGTQAVSCAIHKITPGKDAQGKQAKKPASIIGTDFKSLDQLIPAGTSVNAGLFKTYFVGNKYYFQIPDTLLGRPMIVITRLKKRPMV